MFSNNSHFTINKQSRFTEDIYQMTGYRPGWYWQLTWRYIGPGLMSILLVASIWGYIKEVPKYKAWDAALVSIFFL
jgi:solute carrier family 6 amino acid/orphan transporter-like 15/16/17/18/20